tara:strand:+ start:329 stop:559 length:231 start_codon:yes stop_codon:yes gene_type:complete
MNVKGIFTTIGETLAGITTVLGSVVGVGVMSQIVFGTGWMGIDVIGNISTLVNTFLTGGVTGLIVLLVVLSFFDGK